MLNNLTQMNGRLSTETAIPHFEWLNSTVRLADLTQLMDIQLPATREVLQDQASSLAEALQNRDRRIYFELPSVVVLAPGNAPTAIPSWLRYQRLQGLSFPFLPQNPLKSITNRLALLTFSDLPEVKVAAQLFALETAQAMVRNQIRDLEKTDRPFSENGRLKMDSRVTAEVWLKDQKYKLDLLDTAAQICPAVTDMVVYRQSSARLMRLIENQGKWLSAFLLNELVADFDRLLKENSLNRGISFSLPYFDDRTLDVCYYNFSAIPAGRVMYTPAFVLLAIQKEGVRLFHNSQLSPNSRENLLQTLSAIQNVVKENPGFFLHSKIS
jgi:hypothetical protein